MDADLRQRLITYIEEAESSICGEYHGDQWPNCLDGRHGEGNALIAALTDLKTDLAKEK